MNKEILMNLYAMSFDQGAPIWQQNIDWKNCCELEELFQWLDIEFKYSNNLDTVQAQARKLIIDIVALKESSPQHVDILDFVQFKVSVAILNEVIGLKIFNYAYDWICNSISPTVTEEVEIEREYRAHLIFNFVESEHDFIIKYLPETFLQWTSGLFYYSRSTGGLLELSFEYFSVYFSYLKLLSKYPANFENLVFPLTQIASWSLKHKHEAHYKTSCELLFLLYQSPISIQSKKIIALFFSGCKNTHNKYTKRQWCDIIRNQYYHNLIPHEYIQLFTNRYENDLQLIEQNIHELYGAIDIYHQYINEQIDDKIASYELSRIYSLFGNMLNTLLLNSKVNLATDIICYYFRIEEQKRIKGQILYIIPNTHAGVGYFLNGSQITTDTDSLSNIPKIIKAGNEFLSTTNTLDDDSSFKYDKPHRLGSPIKEKANAYFEAISEHFQLNRLRYIPNLNLMTGLHLFYGTKLPIQAIISAEIDLVVPYIQSFHRPVAQRKIQNVLIWEGDTLLSQIECNALKNIFSLRNINFASLDHFSSSKEEFLLNYNDSIYDLVWICCHGQFNHMEAHKSYLDLGSGIHLTLEELQQQAIESDSRRLFVIDACDGATTSLINSPVALGIGSSVVNSYQSLISHQWPIDNYSALISGILLALHLSNDFDYSTALNETLKIFRTGKDEILRVMDESIDEDVKERIERAPIDYKNFYSWGSLAYHI